MVISKVLITGSSDGLGLAAGKRLLAAGHEGALHARNENRTKDAQAAAPTAAAVGIGDVASIAETRAVAEQANRLGPFDAASNNVGACDRERGIETADGVQTR